MLGSCFPFFYFTFTKASGELAAQKRVKNSLVNNPEFPTLSLSVCLLSSEFNDEGKRRESVISSTSFSLSVFHIALSGNKKKSLKFMLMAWHVIMVDSLFMGLKG